MKQFYGVFAGPILLLGLVGCKSTEYTAHWLRNPVTLDAYYADWQGDLTSVADGGFSYGFQRDSSYLYVCLIATNRQVQRRIMMHGLEMHFDPDGKKAQRISIQYPLRRVASRPPMPDMMQPQADRSGVKPLEMLGRFQNSLGELEIKSAGDEAYTRYALAELFESGLGVKASAETGEWICEMSIPLGSADTFRYALGRKDVSFIKIRFKTPDSDVGGMRGQRPEHGGGRMGGGMPPGGGLSGGPGGRQERPEPFKFDVRVNFSGNRDL